MQLLYKVFSDGNFAEQVSGTAPLSLRSFMAALLHLLLCFDSGRHQTCVHKFTSVSYFSQPTRAHNNLYIRSLWFFFFFNPGLNRISQSVQLLSCVWTLRPHGLQHTRPPCPSPTPGVYLNSCPLSWWCHPAISLSAVPPSQSFQMSQFFTSGGQSIGVSASTSVFPMNIQDLFSLGWTGWISQQSKGLSRVFSNATVQKNQFFGA